MAPIAKKNARHTDLFLEWQPLGRVRGRTRTDSFCSGDRPAGGGGLRKTCKVMNLRAEAGWRSRQAADKWLSLADLAQIKRCAPTLTGIRLPTKQAAESRRRSSSQSFEQSSFQTTLATRAVCKRDRFIGAQAISPLSANPWRGQLLSATGQPITTHLRSFGK